MRELDTKTELNERLRDEAAVLHRKVGVCRHQMGLLYEDFHKEREEWKRRERDMNDANRLIKEKLAGAGAKIEEYEDHLKVFERGNLALQQLVEFLYPMGGCPRLSLPSCVGPVLLLYSMVAGKSNNVADCD